MQNQNVYDELLAKFEKQYGKKPEIVSYAPGRIEVLGNHTDYNEGFVFSAAIQYGTFFAVAPRKDREVHVTAGDLMKEISYTIDKIEKRSEDTWQNYVNGTFACLFPGKTAGLGHGFDAMFLGNVPLGAGLSSSAALEMATAKALCKLYGLEIDTVTMAKAGQKAEHEYAGCPCGLLDQLSSLAGKEGQLVKSDFRSNTYENVPLGDGVVFMMVTSPAKHALVDGAYATRRKACEDAAAHFAKVLRHPVTHLRDVSMAEWVLYKGGLDETQARRAVHPIGEDERVLAGAKLLEKGDVKSFGAFMYDSHESSRSWFENSSPELDAIVDFAKEIPEVLGARLSGGGFGGSCVLLVKPEAAEAIEKTINSKYEAKFGERCKISVIKASEGAHVVA